MKQRQIKPDDQDDNGEIEQAEIISSGELDRFLLTVTWFGGCGWSKPPTLVEGARSEAVRLCRAREASAKARIVIKHFKFER